MVDNRPEKASSASPEAEVEDENEANDAMNESTEKPTQTESATQPNSSSETAQIPSFDGSNDPMPQGNAAEISAAEARIPQKKDATLREFLGKMDEYAPIIPDAVTNHYLTIAGLPPPPQTPPHLARLLALATQKFVADIAADAYQYARIRSTHTTSNTANAMMGVSMGLPGQSTAPGAPGAAGAKDSEKSKAAVGLGMQRPGYGGGGQGGGQGRTVLTMEDLGMAVGEYGVNVKRGEFYR